MRRRLKLRTVLLSVNLIVLILPLAGISLIRLYDSELTRRTEAELIAQGAYVASAFKLAHGFEAPPNGSLQPVLPSIDLSETLVLPPAPPLQDATGTPSTAALDAGRRVMPLLREAKRTTLTGVRVVDARGVLVSTSGDTDQLGQSYAHYKEVQHALTGQPLSVLREREEKSPPLDSISRGNSARVWVALPVIEGEEVLGAVLLNRTPISLTKALYEKRYALIFLTVVVLAGVLFISSVTSRLVSRPIRELIDQTQRVSRGEVRTAEPIERPGTHELDQLSRAFASMSQTLAERSDYIKSFAAHVSHEFKTPLTAIRGSIELLQDHMDTMSEEERERFLSNIAQDAARLDRLVRSLLELARADTLQPGLETCHPGPILEQLAERFRTLGHPVELNADELSAIAMAEPTFESVVTALLDNAHEHGGPTIPIVIHARQEGEHLEVLVRDEGPGVSEGNALRIFDPFFTTARERGGSGLGLSIIASIARAHHGTIEHVPTEAGACFSLRLPRAINPPQG